MNNYRIINNFHYTFNCKKDYLKKLLNQENKDFKSFQIKLIIENYGINTFKKMKIYNKI